MKYILALLIIATVSLQAEVCKIKEEKISGQVYVRTYCIDNYEHLKGNGTWTQKFRNGNAGIFAVDCSCKIKTKRKGWWE